MSNLWKLVLAVLAVMLVPTYSKPMEATDEQLSEMERDLASLSNLSDEPKQDAGDDKIPESLLKDLQESQDDSLHTVPVHQGFPPGTAPDDNSEKPMEAKGSLLRDDDVKDTQRRLFDILSQAKSEDESEDSKLKSSDSGDEDRIPTSLLEEKRRSSSTDRLKMLEALQGFAQGTAPDDNSENQGPKEWARDSKLMSSDEEEGDKDKIPEDLLKDLKAESADKKHLTKKEMLTSILMDEIVNEIKEKNKRGERIPYKVLELLDKYNAKRSGPKL